MLKKLVVVEEPNKYSDKVFNYSYHYEQTNLETLDDALKFHKNIKDYAVAYSGVTENTSYHFPAFAKDRVIYKEECKEKRPVGILCLTNPYFEENDDE